MDNLSNKIALITGATSGIGAACAREMAEAGATVIIAGRNAVRGMEVVKAIRKDKGVAYFVELDICSNTSIKSVYEFVDTKFGRLDILVNNAGVFPVTPDIKELTREFNEVIWDTNISGMLMMVKEFLGMLRNSNGTIINNASVAGLQNFCSGGAYSYSASKAGIIKITQMLAKKYGSEIRVNCICPGVIRTPIFKKFDEQRYVTSIPAGRVGEPKDVAKVVKFLASSDAGYLNGVILPIDGGQSL